jgi:hypothetical protein
MKGLKHKHVTHPYNGILFSHKGDKVFDVCYNTDEP